MNGALKVKTGGVGIGGLTFVMLLVLKLVGEVSISWFAVITSIIWAPLAVFAAVMFFLLIFYVAVALVALVAYWIRG